MTIFGFIKTRKATESLLLSHKINDLLSMSVPCASLLIERTWQRLDGGSNEYCCHSNE